MKQCTKCKIVKSFSEFSKLKHAKDGFQSQCKCCIAVNSKKYYKDNTKKCKQTIKKLHTSKSGIYEWVEGNTTLYVGQSSWLYSRINSHKSWHKNYNSAPKYMQPLYESLQNHPNAYICIIEECSTDKLLEREKHYIDTKKPLYNIFYNKMGELTQ